MQLSEHRCQLCKNYWIDESVFFVIDDIVLASCRRVLQQWYLPLKINIWLLVCETAKVMELHACMRFFSERRRNVNGLKVKTLIKKLITNTIRYWTPTTDQRALQSQIVLDNSVVCSHRHLLTRRSFPAVSSA